MKKTALFIYFTLTISSLFAQYKVTDKELIKETFKRNIDKKFLTEYFNSTDVQKYNASLLTISNAEDSILSRQLLGAKLFSDSPLSVMKYSPSPQLLRDNLISENNYLDFAMIQTGFVKRSFSGADMLSKLLSEEDNFEYAFRLYRMPSVPGEPETYVSALRKSLKKNDYRTIPYLLGCLRKLKYFPDDDKLSSELMKLNVYDNRIEVVKVLPYGIKKETALDNYLHFFEDRNRNIARQAAVSISEIVEPFLQPRVVEFISTKIKDAKTESIIKDELLLSLIKLSNPSFGSIKKEYEKYISTKGFIQAAQKIGDNECLTYLFNTASDSDYHNRLFAISALDELNKDSSLTGRLDNLKKKDALIQSLLDENGKPKCNFDELWQYAFKFRSAEINTSKGKIVIKFLPEYAPVSVANFCKLTSNKFFNGNLFHRVVPGFVIQSGDTTNTGWGGPGCSITTEASPLSFNKGMVGMASSGRDTESSQWFITTGNYPHLDGRYSVFGRVTSGLDIAERITQEDKIISVKLIK